MLHYLSMAGGAPMELSLIHIYHYDNQMRFSMYRWNIPDPVRFSEDLKVTIQDLGGYSAGDLYKPRRDDIYTVAYWYQTLPTAPFPKLPDPIDLEIS